LQEFDAPTLRVGVRAGASNLKQLEDAIHARMLKQYNAAGQATLKDLGSAEQFDVQAGWKRAELRAKAKQMANGLHNTLGKEQERIALLPRGERGPARAKMLAYKQRQLTELVDAQGRFQAQTDVLAHSGLVDVRKSKVMRFVAGGSRTCGICLGIIGGNPYTVRQATTLGPKAHPNCMDHWESSWQADEAMMANARRQVADGEAKLWTGKGQTPARGPATRRTSLMQERKGGWRGKAIEQRRLATLRAKRAM